MDDIRTTIRPILDQIGRADLAAALGVRPSAVSQALANSEDGRLPAAWYYTMRSLGARKGIEVPENIFRWKIAS